MEDSNIIPLFSTPLFKNNISIDSNVLEYVKGLEFIPGEQGGSTTCLVTNNIYILNDPALEYLKNQIEQQIDIFLKKQLKISRNLNFKITTSWVAKYQKDHFSKLHNHGNSLFSGVLYLQVHPNSGSISFHQKSSSLYPQELTLEFENYNIFNCGKWTIYPENNDIVIFPSHLQHEVSINETNFDRYAIAFNIFLSGTLRKNSISELIIR
jgi:uncharacterized protein (TIGR02466 family)